MRILALVTEAHGGRGGIAQYNRDLLRALEEYPGCTEIVVVSRIAHDTTEQVAGKIRYLPSKGKGLVSFVRAVNRIARSRTGFDLIICGHINLLPIAWVCGLYRTPAPLVLVIYGIDAWRPRKRLLNNRLLYGVDAVVAISRETLVRFRSWSGFPEGRTTILPNAIHLEKYHPGPKPAYLLERYGLRGMHVLLTMGRLAGAERYKGFDEVLESLPGLLDFNPRLRYLIAGDGDDRSRLEAKAKALGILDRVVFCGWVPEREKADHFRLADVFVMPGRCEGFGFVYLEAMACGIPVIGSRLDGSREALRDGMLGIMVDPDDSVELRGAILKALTKPRTVPPGLEYFSYPRFSERWHDLVRNVSVTGKRLDAAA